MSRRCKTAEEGRPGLFPAPGEERYERKIFKPEKKLWGLSRR